MEMSEEERLAVKRRWVLPPRRTACRRTPAPLNDAIDHAGAPSRSAPRRCLRFLDVLLLIFGAAMCGGALYCSTFMFTRTAQVLMYAVAAVGGLIFVVMCIGILAICSSRINMRILLGVRALDRRAVMHVNTVML